jgi:hypothetical protein
MVFWTPWYIDPGTNFSGVQNTIWHGTKKIFQPNEDQDLPWIFLIDNITSIGLGVRIMVFNATFNNIPDISWQSDLVMDDTSKTRGCNQVLRKGKQFLLH